MSLMREKLSQKVSDQTGSNSSDVRDLVSALLKQIFAALEHHEDVKTLNFTTFRVKPKAERIGRNQKTLQRAIINARSVVSFKPSPNLITRVNDRHG